MMRIGIGLVATLLLAAAGYFGFESYLQQRFAGEVETALEQFRATGAKASHGRVSFNLFQRAITVADLAIETASQPEVRLSFAHLSATGVSLDDPARFSAGQIEASDVSVTASMNGSALHLAAPRILAKDFSSPTGPTHATTAGNPLRSAFEPFAAVSAASIAAPELDMGYGLPGIGETHSVDYHYSNIGLHDIRGGKIAAATIEKTSFTANIQQLGKTERFGGELESSACYDLDVGAAFAIFDPARADDANFIRAYRQATIGAYTATLPNGGRMRIDGASIDDVGVQPAKVQFHKLMAMLAAGQPTATPTPAQARDIIETLASFYEGTRVGNAEIRGFAIELPQSAFRLGAIRFNLDNGKIGEFALEGLDAPTPQGEVKLSRFALHSLDISGMLRLLPLLSPTGQKPAPELLLAWPRLLDGVEVKDLILPYKDRTEPISIASMKLNWGQFIGTVPSKARFGLKMSGPLDANSPDPLKVLAAAGLRSATGQLDLGAAWMESQHSFVLDPVSIEIDHVAAASARLSFGNVPREFISANPQQVSNTAGQIQAGPIDITVRDGGGVDLAVAQFARTKHLSDEDARRTLIEAVNANSSALAKINPDAAIIGDALARFIEMPGQTLSLKLTPKGSVPAMPFFTIFKANPVIALSEFTIDATLTR